MEKQTRIWLLFGVIAVIVIILFFAAFIFLTMQNATTTIPAAPVDYTNFTIGNRSFALTNIAQNKSSWYKGLMNVTITNTTTMLFIFPNESIYPFWMYDTYSNLDIIWINYSGNEGKIVYIGNDLPSCFDESECPIYIPTASANYVLEAKASFVERNNISVGSMIRFR